MSKLLSDWYFTRCLALSDDVSRQLVTDLALLRVTGLAPETKERALGRIADGEPRVRVYCVRALVEQVVNGEREAMRSAASDALRVVVAGIPSRSATTMGQDLIDLLAAVGDATSAGSGADFEALLSAISAKAANSVLTPERTPYFGIDRQTIHVIALSVAACLADHPTYGPVVRDMTSREVTSAASAETAYASLLAGCLRAEVGRLPFLLALDAVSRCEGPDAMRDALATALAEEPGLSTYEPDVLAVAAVAMVPAPGELLDELVYLRRLGALNATSCATDATVSFSRRVALGVGKPVVFRALMWQLAVLDAVLGRTETYGDEIRVVLAPRPHEQRGDVYVDPSERDAVLRAASGLVRASGGMPVSVNMRRHKADAITSAQMATLFASPWLVPEFAGDDANYPSLDTLFGALRLASAAISAAYSVCRSMAGQTEAESGPLTTFLLYAESALHAGRRRVRRSEPPWQAAVDACTAVLDAITVGRVARIDPDALDGWVFDATDHLRKTLPDADLGANLSLDLEGRALSWVEQAIPFLEESGGPGRWREEVGPLLDQYVNSTDVDPDVVRARVLDDTLARLGLRAARTAFWSSPSWPEIAARETPPTGWDVLGASAGSWDDWSHPGPAELAEDALLALAIRRLEAAEHVDADTARALFKAFAEALAASIRIAAPSVPLLVRGIALIAHPTVRERHDWVEQIVAIALDADEPYMWRYVFDRAHDGHDRELGADQYSWRVLAAALIRLQHLAGTSDHRLHRLRAMWCACYAHLCLGLGEHDRRDVAESLIAAADLHSNDAARDDVPVNLSQPRANVDALRVEGEVGSSAAWSLQCVALDPVRDEHSGWLRPYQSDVATPLAAQRGGGRPAVATVIAFERDDVVLNVGAPEPVRARWWGTAQARDDSDYVLLNSAASRAEPLPVHKSHGHPTRVTLESNPEGLGRTLLLQSQRGAKREPVNHRLWDADTSRAYTGASDDRAVVARYDDEAGWQPFHRDGLALVVLLATEHEPTTLVYNGAQADGWLFSTRPGELYGVRRSDFDDTAAVALQTALDDVTDPVGLLVTMQLTDQFRIELSSQPGTATSLDDLRCPFDDRNIRWRSALSAHWDGKLVSQLDGKFPLPVDPPIPPFPAGVVARLQPGRRREQEFITPERFTPRDQRIGSVGANVEYTHELSGDPADVFEELLRPRPDLTVTLTRIVGQANPGAPLLCATAHGYVVKLNMEDVTLAPLDVNKPVLAVAGRVARLRRGRRGQPVVEMDLHAEALRRAETRAALAGGAVEGVVWQARLGRTRDAEVVVKFDVAGHPTETLSFGEASVRLGATVRLSRTPGTDRLRAEVTNPALWVDTVWQRLPDRELEPGALYVGDFGRRSRGSAQGVAECAPGRLVVFDLDTELSPFSSYDGTAWVPPAQQWNTCQIREATSGVARERTWISVREGFVSGSVSRQLAAGPGELREIEIQLAPLGGGTAVSRRLHLANAVVPGMSARRPSREHVQRARAADADEDRVDADEELQRLAQAGAPVEVQVEPHQLGTAVVVDLVNAGVDHARATLPVIDAQPVIVSSANYDPTGIAMIVRQDYGGFALSFRDVPHLDVTAYAELLGAVLDDDVDTQHLVYARKEGELHVFEFGFGLHVAAPAASLRFDGGPFEQLGSVLFHGDRIRRISFSLVDEDLVMKVQQASISAATGTTLYRQAKDMSFLHVIRVQDVGGALRVVQIEGFDERSVRHPSRLYEGPRIAHVILHEDDVVALPRESRTHSGITMYAELDVDRFEETAGVVLQYRRCTLSPDLLKRRADPASEFRPAVVTFVRGGVIEPLGKAAELGLQLTSATTQSADLEGRVYVIRRSFSIDVNQLRRLRALEKDDALQGSLLVAYFELAPETASGMSATLKDRSVPNRSSDSLKDLASSREGLLLLVDEVTRISGRIERVRLEYRHGIFFVLDAAEVDAVPDDVTGRDVVRVEWDVVLGVYTMARCSPSELRFFSQRPRPLIALPTNPLLSQSAVAASDATDFWRNKTFVGAGLPSLVARAGSLDSERGWRWARPKECAEFMRQSHPKIGLFGIDNHGRLVMAPPRGVVPHGGVAFPESGGAEVITATARRAVDPAVLTFADGTAHEVAERARTTSWGFHDDKTGYWSGKSIETQDLAAHRLEGGPVFFDSDDRLRYTGNLVGWSFSSGFLSQGVKHEGQPFWVAVAGHSAGAGGSIDGLYLEVVPGIVCLVLEGLLTLRVADGVRVRLDSMSIVSFGMGDLVQIVITEDSSRSVDGVEIVAWQRSARAHAGLHAPNDPAALGNRFVTPVVGFDAGEGELVCGAGRFSLSIPTFTGPTSDLIAIDAANRIDAFDGQWRTDDTFLISLTDRQFCVAGQASQRVRAASEPHWRGDGWHSHLFEDGSFHDDRLRQLIDGCGGTIAATVEWVNKQGIVMFTFRNQSAALAAARPLVGSIAGHSGVVMFIRAAGATVRAVGDHVVLGLPERLVSAAADELRDSAALIWLHPQDGGYGPIRTLPPSPSHRFVGVASVSSDDVCGLVARDLESNALVWLPATELAHSVLDGEDVRALWLEEPRPTFRASYVVDHSAEVDATPSASILQLQAVQDERAALHRGHRFGVVLRCAAPGRESSVCFGETGEGAIVEVMVGDGSEWHPGDQLVVEVQTVTERGRRVVTVPANERRIELTLPAAYDEYLSGEDVERGAFVQFLDALAEPTNLQPLTASIISQPTDSHLAHAFASVRHHGRPSAIAATLATDWLRALPAAGEVDLVKFLVALDLLLSASVSGGDELADSDLDDKMLDKSRARWASAANLSLASLGRRAIRSLHVEALMRYWIRQRRRRTGIPWVQWDAEMAEAGRCVQLRTTERWQPVLRHLETAAGREGRMTAGAIRMAYGDSSAAPALLDDGDLLLPQLVKNVRRSDPTLYGGPRAAPAVVRNQQLEFVHRALERVRREREDIVVLGDPPWIRRDVR